MKDPKAEQMLDAHLVDYVYVDGVPIEQIDIEQSLRNQARIDPPLYTDVVTTYAEAMGDGAEFPAIVGYTNKDDTIVLIDGNHRIAAHVKHGSDEVDVYIVDATQDVIQALTYMANATHGRPPSDEERLHHAIHLRDLGYSNRDAARAVALTESRVTVAWQLESLRRRARKLNVHKGFESINKDTRYKLAPIQSDVVFKHLVQFIVASRGLTRQEVQQLITDVKTGSDEASQLQAIIEFKEAKRNEQRTSGRTKHRLDARRSVLPHLGYLHQQDPEAVANATLTVEQRENLKDHLIKAVGFCNALMELIVEQEGADRSADGS